MARNGLFATLENINNTPFSEGESDAAVLDAVEAGAETAAMDEENQRIATQLEDASDAESDLVEVADTLQESVDAGTGMDPVAARATEIAVESIMKRCGEIGVGKKVVASVESFGSTNTKLHSTKVSLEGVWETIKEYWKKFKEMLIQIMNGIKDFFAKFFDNAEKTKKAAESLKKEVGELGSKKAKETEMSSGAAKAFSLKGAANEGTVKTILGNQTKLLENTTKAFGNFQGLISKVSSVNLQNAEQTKLDGSGAFLGYNLRKLGIVDGIGRDVPEKDATKEDSSAKTKTEVQYAGPFLGHRVVSITTVTSTEADNGGVTISLALTESADKVADKAKVLSDSEMTSVLNEVIALCGKVETYKKEQGKTETIVKELNKVVNSIIKATESNQPDDQAKDVKTAIANIKGVTKSVAALTQRLSTLAPSMAVSAGNAANSYVRDSLKQYKAN